MISAAIVNIMKIMITLIIITNIITMMMAKGGGGGKHIVWRPKGSGGSCAGGLSGKKKLPSTPNGILIVIIITIKTKEENCKVEKESQIFGREDNN